MEAPGRPSAIVGSIQVGDQISPRVRRLHRELKISIRLELVIPTEHGVVNALKHTREELLRAMQFTAAPSAKRVTTVKKVCAAGHSLGFHYECIYVSSTRAVKFIW